MNKQGPYLKAIEIVLYYHHFLLQPLHVLIIIIAITLQWLCFLNKVALINC